MKRLLKWAALAAALSGGAFAQQRSQLVQTYSPVTLQAGSQGTYTLTIKSVATPNLSNVAISVPNIGGAAQVLGATTTCAGGNVTTSGTGFSLTGGNLAAGGQCSVTVSYRAVTTPGSYTTTLSAGQLTATGSDGQQYNSTENAADTVGVTPVSSTNPSDNSFPSVDKSYSPQSVDPKVTTPVALSFTLSNESTKGTVIAINDSPLFPDYMVFNNVTSTCINTYAGTINGTTADFTQRLNPGEVCKITITSTYPANALSAFKSFSNTVRPTFTNDGEQTKPALTSTSGFYVGVAPTNPPSPNTSYIDAQKKGRFDGSQSSDNTGPIDHNAYWEFTLRPLGYNLTNISFTDTFEAGDVANPAGVVNNCGGFINFNSDLNGFTYNNPSLNDTNDNCVIRIPLNVTGKLAKGNTYNNYPQISYEYNGNFYSEYMSNASGGRAVNTYDKYSSITGYFADENKVGIANANMGQKIWVAVSANNLTSLNQTFNASGALSDNTTLSPDSSRQSVVICGENNDKTTLNPIAPLPNPVSFSLPASRDTGPGANSYTVYTCTAYYPYTVVGTGNAQSLVSIVPSANLTARQTAEYKITSGDLRIGNSNPPIAGNLGLTKSFSKQLVRSPEPFNLILTVFSTISSDGFAAFSPVSITDHLPEGMYAVMPNGDNPNQADGSYTDSITSPGGAIQSTKTVKRTISADRKTIYWVISGSFPPNDTIITQVRTLKPGDLINTINPTDVGYYPLANAASASVKTDAYIGIVKNFNRSSIPQGQQFNMSLDIVNAYQSANTLQFIDNLPSGLSVVQPMITGGSCVGLGATPTVVGQTLTVSNIQMQPASQCRFTIRLQANQQGTFTNTINTRELTSSLGEYNVDPTSATITVTAPTTVTPTVQKTQAICTLDGRQATNCSTQTTEQQNIKGCQAIRYVLTTSNPNTTNLTARYAPTLRDTLPSYLVPIAISGSTSNGKSLLFDTGSGFSFSPSLPTTGGATIKAGVDSNGDGQFNVLDELAPSTSFTVTIDTTYPSCLR